MNRIAVSIAAVSAAVCAAPALAQTSEARTVCVRGADERIIEIVSPGEVGARCDVRYARDGGANVRTPYHANNAADFCAEKAAELVAELRAAGFQCDAGAPGLRDAGAEPPASDFVIETQRGAEPAETGPAEAAPAEETPPAEDETSPREEASLQEPAAPTQEDELAALMSEILSQPVSETLEQPAGTAAVRGPANLTEGVGDEIIDVASSAPLGAPAGRLVGADPAADENPAPLGDAAPEEGAPAPAVPVTQAAAPAAAQAPAQAAVADAPPGNPLASDVVVAEAAAPRPETAASAAPEESTAQEPAAAPQNAQPQLVRQAFVQAPPAPAAASSGVPTLLRRPADIVRATVRAQAAAWNEGNLDAFMDVYARDDNLIYVSGDEVTRGWSAARKRYRDRYDGPAGMGRIDFEKLDAELVTEDVAVVTGQLRHAIGEEISKAVFSMVMKREQGVWRIVHDHTAPAATASQ